MQFASILTSCLSLSDENNGPNATNHVNEDEAEIINIDVNSTEVDMNHCRIKSMTSFRDNLSRQLEFLGLRNNLISKIESIDIFTNLKVLELYDNQITKIENLDSLVNLE